MSFWGGGGSDDGRVLPQGRGSQATGGGSVLGHAAGLNSKIVYYDPSCEQLRRLNSRRREERGGNGDGLTKRQAVEMLSRRRRCSCPCLQNLDCALFYAKTPASRVCLL